MSRSTQQHSISEVLADFKACAPEVYEQFLFFNNPKYVWDAGDYPYVKCIRILEHSRNSIEKLFYLGYSLRDEFLNVLFEQCVSCSIHFLKDNSLQRFKKILQHSGTHMESLAPQIVRALSGYRLEYPVGLDTPEFTASMNCVYEVYLGSYDKDRKTAAEFLLYCLAENAEFFSYLKSSKNEWLEAILTASNHELESSNQKRTHLLCNGAQKIISMAPLVNSYVGVSETHQYLATKRVDLMQRPCTRVTGLLQEEADFFKFLFEEGKIKAINIFDDDFILSKGPELASAVAGEFIAESEQGNDYDYLRSSKDYWEDSELDVLRTRALELLSRPEISIEAAQRVVARLEKIWALHSEKLGEQTNTELGAVIDKKKVQQKLGQQETPQWGSAGKMKI